jgi:acetylcholinesterase
MVFAKSNPSVRWAWQPVIDGDVVRSPFDSWKSGNWNKMPILTGFNTNEGSMFVPQDMSRSEEFTNFFRVLRPEFNEEDLQTLNELYPDPAKNPGSPYCRLRHPDLGSQFERVEAAYAHFAYIAPTRYTAQCASVAQEAPVYLYHFAPKITEKGGTNHGDHSGYVTYDRVIVKISDTQKSIAGQMHAYWTSFVTSGDPNKIPGKYPERPRWGKYEPRGKLMMFGEGNDERAGGSQLGTVSELKDDNWAIKECDFWWSKALISERVNLKAKFA